MNFCLNSNLIKTFLNANIWMTLIFHKDGYDLKDHERSHKARLTEFFLAYSFINRFWTFLSKTYLCTNIMQMRTFFVSLLVRFCNLYLCNKILKVRNHCLLFVGWGEFIIFDILLHNEDVSKLKVGLFFTHIIFENQIKTFFWKEVLCF